MQMAALKLFFFPPHHSNVLPCKQQPLQNSNQIRAEKHTVLITNDRSIIYLSIFDLPTKLQKYEKMYYLSVDLAAKKEPMYQKSGKMRVHKSRWLTGFILCQTAAAILQVGHTVFKWV